MGLAAAAQQLQASTPAASPSPSPSSAPASTPAPATESTAKISETGARSNPRASADASRARDTAGRFTAFKQAQAEKHRVDDEGEPLPQRKQQAKPEVADDGAVDDVTTETTQEPAAAEPAVEASADPATWPEPARRALQASEQRFQQAQSQIDEWRGAGHEVHQQNLSLLKRLRFWMQHAQRLNQLPDPRDLQILDYQIAQEAQTSGVDLQKRQSEARVKALADETLSTWRADAQRLATASRLDTQEVLLRYAQALNAHRSLKREGPEPSMADVVADMAAIQAARQQKAQASVPALLGEQTKQSRAVVKFPSTPQGWRDALKAKGHEID